jgi:hypothetical protein
MDKAWWFGLLALIIFIIILSFWVAIGFVAIHFVMKYW